MGIHKNQSDKDAAKRPDYDKAADKKDVAHNSGIKISDTKTSSNNSNNND